MKLVLTQAIILAATLATSFAHAEGKFIARKDLPAAVATVAKKSAKFPGVPSCAKGRLVTAEWPASVERKDHKCADASQLYVCAAFGKLSIRCE